MILRLYLEVFYAPFSKEGSIYLKLFESLNNSGELNNSMHQSASPDSQRKNIERFEEKILESLVLPINVSRTSLKIDPVDRDIIRALNYLQISKRLASMGEINGTIRVLRKGLKIFRILEQFDFAIYCLNQLSTISVFRNKPMKSINFDDEFSDLEKMRSNYLQAIRLREKSFKFYLIDSPSEKDFESLKLINSQCLEIINEPFSSSVERNILYTKLLYFDKRQDIKSCLDICHELKELIQNNVAIRKNKEIDTIEIILAQFYVLDFDFSKSQELVKSIFKKSALSDINESYMTVVQCRHSIYLSKISECIDLVDDTLSKEWFSPIFKEQLLLIKGYALYLGQRPKEAILILDNVNELKKDKSGWNFYYRVLIILSFYVMSNSDSLLNEIENFRRYLHGKKLSKRQEYQVVRIMNLANFEAKIKSKKTNVEDIEDWNPASSEVYNLDLIFFKNSIELYH